MCLGYNNVCTIIYQKNSRSTWYEVLFGKIWYVWWIAEFKERGGGKHLLNEMSRLLSAGIDCLSPICIFITHISSIIIFLSCHFMTTKQQQQCLRHGIYNYRSSKTKQAVIPYCTGFLSSFWRKKGTFSFLNIFPGLKYVSVLLHLVCFHLRFYTHLTCFDVLKPAALYYFLKTITLSTLFGYATPFMTCMAASQTWLTTFPLRPVRCGCTGGTLINLKNLLTPAWNSLKKKKSPNSMNTIHGEGKSNWNSILKCDLLK